MKVRIKNLLLFIAICFCVSCSISEQITSYHGYVFPESYDKGLVLNKTTKQQILSLMGTPSYQSQYGQQQLYYIGYVQENLAFTKSKTINRTILQLTMGKDNTLQSKELIKELPDTEVVFDQNRTTIPGNSIGAFEQMLSNVGRFNNK